MLSRDIRAGMILRLRSEEHVPADLVLLRSSSPDGLCFIETSNLDGESNLKLRKAPPLTSAMAESELPRLHDQLEAQLPNADLYTFVGRYCAVRLLPPQICSSVEAKWRRATRFIRCMRSSFCSEARGCRIPTTFSLRRFIWAEIPSFRPQPL